MLLVLAASAPAVSRAAGPDVPPATRLAVRLTTVQDLPAGARAALTTEVDRIWSRAGVELEWSPGVVPPIASGVPSIRVLVVSTHAPGPHAGHTWPIAELLPGTGVQPVAIASVEAAERVLRVTGHTDEPVSLVQRRLGVVLGRAVAHEIGHALLGSRHGRHGLMRARIDASEFADLRDGGFGLDRAGTEAARVALTGRPPRLAAAQ